MTEKKTIHELIETVEAEMRELEYSEKTLESYKAVWWSFEEFAESKNIKLYTTEAGLEFLEHECKFVSKYPIKYTKEQKVRAINRIDEYFKYQIISTKRSHKKVYAFPAQFNDQVDLTPVISPVLNLGSKPFENQYQTPWSQELVAYNQESYGV